MNILRSPESRCIQPLIIQQCLLSSSRSKYLSSFSVYTELVRPRSSCFSINYLLTCPKACSYFQLLLTVMWDVFPILLELTSDISSVSACSYSNAVMLLLCLRFQVTLTITTLKRTHKSCHIILYVHLSALF